MGMGEPLINADNVLAACERLPDIGISARRTAIPPVGWIGIEMPAAGRGCRMVTGWRPSVHKPATRPTLATEPHACEVTALCSCQPSEKCLPTNRDTRPPDKEHGRLIPGIKLMHDDAPKVRLALSVHAADEGTPTQADRAIPCPTS